MKDALPVLCVPSDLHVRAMDEGPVVAVVSCTNGRHLRVSLQRGAGPETVPHNSLTVPVTWSSAAPGMVGAQQQQPDTLPGLVASLQHSLDRRGPAGLATGLALAASLQRIPAAGGGGGDGGGSGNGGGSAGSAAASLTLTLLLPAAALTLTPLYGKRLCEVPLTAALAQCRPRQGAAAGAAAGTAQQQQLGAGLGEDVQSGYLTMDQARSLVPLAAEDANVYSVPLVGVWVRGAPGPAHPALLAAALKFAFCASLPDRAVQPDGAFLLLLFTGDSPVPRCYEARFSDPQPQQPQPHPHQPPGTPAALRPGDVSAAAGGGLRLLPYVARGDLPAPPPGQATGPGAGAGLRGSGSGPATGTLELTPLLDTRTVAAAGARLVLPAPLVPSAAAPGGSAAQWQAARVGPGTGASARGQLPGQGVVAGGASAAATPRGSTQHQPYGQAAWTGAVTAPTPSGQGTTGGAASRGYGAVSSYGMSCGDSTSYDAYMGQLRGSGSKLMTSPSKAMKLLAGAGPGPGSGAAGGVRDAGTTAVGGDPFYGTRAGHGYWDGEGVSGATVPGSARAVDAAAAAAASMARAPTGSAAAGLAAAGSTTAHGLAAAPRQAMRCGGAPGPHGVYGDGGDLAACDSPPVPRSNALPTPCRPAQSHGDGGRRVSGCDGGGGEAEAPRDPRLYHRAASAAALTAPTVPSAAPPQHAASFSVAASAAPRSGRVSSQGEVEEVAAGAAATAAATAAARASGEWGGAVGGVMHTPAAAAPPPPRPQVPDAEQRVLPSLTYGTHHRSSSQRPSDGCASAVGANGTDYDLQHAHGHGSGGHGSSARNAASATNHGATHASGGAPVISQSLNEWLRASSAAAAAAPPPAYQALAPTTGEPPPPPLLLPPLPLQTPVHGREPAWWSTAAAAPPPHGPAPEWRSTAAAAPPLRSQPQGEPRGREASQPRQLEPALSSQREGWSQEPRPDLTGCHLHMQHPLPTQPQPQHPSQQQEQQDPNLQWEQQRSGRCGGGEAGGEEGSGLEAESVEKAEVEAEAQAAGLPWEPALLRRMVVQLRRQVAMLQEQLERSIAAPHPPSAPAAAAPAVVSGATPTAGGIDAAAGSGGNSVAKPGPSRHEPPPPPPPPPQQQQQGVRQHIPMLERVAEQSMQAPATREELQVENQGNHISAAVAAAWAHANPASEEAAAAEAAAAEVAARVAAAGAWAATAAATAAAAAAAEERMERMSVSAASDRGSVWSMASLRSSLMSYTSYGSRPTAAGGGGAAAVPTAAAAAEGGAGGIHALAAPQALPQPSLAPAAPSATETGPRAAGEWGIRPPVNGGTPGHRPRSSRAEQVGGNTVPGQAHGGSGAGAMAGVNADGGAGAAAQGWAAGPAAGAGSGSALGALPPGPSLQRRTPHRGSGAGGWGGGAPGSVGRGRRSVRRRGSCSSSSSDEGGGDDVSVASDSGDEALLLRATARPHASAPNLATPSAPAPSASAAAGTRAAADATHAGPTSTVSSDTRANTAHANGPHFAATTASRGQSHSQPQPQPQSLGLVRTAYVPLEEDSDSSDSEGEALLMQKYGIRGL